MIMVTAPTQLSTQEDPLNFFIKGETPNYTRHDQLFKQLIETFFEEFIEAFFPDLHEQIDFKEVTFLSEEVLPVMHDENKSILDLVIEVKVKETDALIVVHVEPQSYVQTNFNERMFRYFSMLYNRLKKPIIPIALFSYEEAWETDAFNMTVLDVDVLRFNYLTLHLRNQNWQTFIKQDNPVAAALLSKMGYEKEEKVKVKLEFFQMLVRLELDREKMTLLIGFFEAYLKLSEKEEEQFMKEAKKLKDADKVFDIPISYVEKGKAIGEKIGIEKGEKIGIEKGERVGRKIERNEVALKMIAKGLDDQLIMEMTGISEEEFFELKMKQ